MSKMNDLFEADVEQEIENIGYRLVKVQLYNWGTFDSQDQRVHTIDPEGNTTLLIGRNGTGKSTLVDAILTLLSPPRERSYNLAAGSSGKRERNEKTYIQGAYGHTSSSESHRAQTQYLRPGRGHYTVVLAQFINVGTDEKFTLAQLLYLNTQDKPERLFCWAEDLHTIESSFSGIDSMEMIVKKIKSRGLEVTKTFTNYGRFLRKKTGMAEKALDVFNQTVAVKEIHSLDDFIRSHMLQKRNWKTVVNNVLVHFDILTQAYDTLVQAREELELLEPVEKVAIRYEKEVAKETEQRNLQANVPLWFAHQTRNIVAPVCREWQRKLEGIQAEKTLLDGVVNGLARQKAELEMAMNNSGDVRLNSLRSQIREQEAELKPVLGKAAEVQRILRLLSLGDNPNSSEEWGNLQNNLDRARSKMSAENNNLARRQAELAHDVIAKKEKLAEIKREYNALLNRRTQLPESYQQLRNEICSALGLSIEDLPFAAELISVSEQSYAWESSIEKVLRTMALTLLVTEDQYHRVSHFIDSSKLKDDRGRGMRLHYERINTDLLTEPEIRSRSLISHLDFKDTHPLSMWLKDRIAKRFNYRCCETIEEFQNERGAAMTVNRHIKHNISRHEKDDRSFAMRDFVLGWDNARKISFLKQEAEELLSQRDEIKKEKASVEGRVNQNNSYLEKIRDLLEIKFVEIDVKSVQDSLDSVRNELRQLEQSDEQLKQLKLNLQEATLEYEKRNADRDARIGQIRQTQLELDDGEKMLANANRKIEESKKGETAEMLEASEVSFQVLEKWIANEEALTLGTLSYLENDAKQMAAERLQNATQSLASAENGVIKTMSSYLRKFPEQQATMQAEIESLHEFRVKLQVLKKQDLPKYEKRFKENLNQKVTQEIAVLNQKLRDAGRLVEKKISQLNQSLSAISDAGKSYMELAPIRTKDREIVAFRQELKECLSGALGGGEVADEARYKTIAKFIKKLKEEERWRDRVIDVRKWFHFAVTERSAVDHSQIGYHTDSGGKSGGEKARLAFTILVAAIAYQFNIDPSQSVSSRFHFVMVDEMFSKVDDKYAEYALNLFKRFGLQLLIVAPFDAKARITEPYVKHYLHVIKDANHSHISSMKAEEVRKVVKDLDH